MPAWLQIVVTSLVAVFASSGFWAYLQRRDTTKSATNRLLLGLAYDKITTRGLEYIERGWISRDEFEDFQKYLYEPYVEFGGNGVAERIMQEVSKLPLTNRDQYAAQIIQAKHASQGDL